jgi:hypothetical protein
MTMNILPTPEDFMALTKVLAKPTTTKRRVRFAPAVSSSSSTCPLAREELSELWYNQQDLANLKYQARKLAMAARQHGNKHNYDVLRGLENCTLERHLHRHRTIQCTLSAHRKGMSAGETAMIARRCTAWNEEIAFVQACHDYCTVYQPSIAAGIPEVSNTPPKFPFALKRAIVDLSEPQRRVRRRTSLYAMK